MNETTTTAMDGPTMILRIGDVAEVLGRSRAAARRLLAKLEAQGLRRKGAGSATHWLADEFWHYYREMDTRP